MLRNRRITYLCLAALWLALPGQLRAQWVTHLSQEKIDSLANPAAAKGSEAMRFETRRIETPELREDGAPTTYTYRWHNDGSEPLVVTRVRTTCGCAKAEYDGRPVPAGGQGEVKVTYYPKGHPGAFRRKIFVYTQLSETQPTAVLELTGHVEPSALPTHDYDYAMGPLLLKQRTVRLAGDRKQTERIECLNAGEKPLRPRADEGLLPEYLTLVCEPEVMGPGETGDLVIRFDPERAPQRMPERIPILLEGITLPPSQRMLEARIGHPAEKPDYGPGQKGTTKTDSDK